MRNRSRRSDNQVAAWMLLPFLTFFAVFVVYPLGKNLYYSFMSYSFNTQQPAKFIGLGNYARMLKDVDFLLSLRNTAVYAVFSVVLLTAAGLFMAVMLNRASRLSKAARTAMIIPYATSLAAVSLIWLLLLDPAAGPVNKLLIAFGMRNPPGWLFNPGLALPSLIAINVWKNTGYAMILFLAGLQSVPPELYEAATLDGANAWRKLIDVTLPSIAPITVFVMITNCIEAFKTFETVKIMTKGGPMLQTATVVYQIYVRAFEDYQMGYASALSTVLLLILLCITLLNFKPIVARAD